LTKPGSGMGIRLCKKCSGILKKMTTAKSKTVIGEPKKVCQTATTTSDTPLTLPSHHRPPPSLFFQIHFNPLLYLFRCHHLLNHLYPVFSILPTHSSFSTTKPPLSHRPLPPPVLFSPSPSYFFIRPPHHPRLVKQSISKNGFPSEMVMISAMHADLVCQSYPFSKS